VTLHLKDALLVPAAMGPPNGVVKVGVHGDVGVADVRMDEARGRTLLGQFGDELLAGLAPVAGNDDGLGAFACGGTRDGRSQSLASAADKHDFAVEQRTISSPSWA
jgi:hypothetical protein